MYFKSQQLSTSLVWNIKSKTLAKSHYNSWDKVWINRHDIQRIEIEMEIYLWGKGKRKKKYRHTLSVHSIPDSQRYTSISPDSTLLLTHVTCYFICISASTFHTHWLLHVNGPLRACLTRTSLEKTDICKVTDWFIAKLVLQTEFCNYQALNIQTFQN